MTGRWWIACVAAVAGWVGLGIGAALAGSLVPVTKIPATAPLITLSILAPNGVDDVADTYLPEVTVDAAGTVTGKTVTLRISGLASPVITLLSSTAYPGTCTNFSAPRAAGAASSDTNADGTPKLDFQPVVNNQLTSLDCGGTATIQVTGGGNTYTFKLPKDANNNGIADSFEAPFGGNLVANADPDNDGLSNFDEYRGFIVSRKLVRGDPTKKDLFVSLVNSQTAASLSLPAGLSLLGRLPGAGNQVYPIDGTPLNASMDSLSAVARVHLLGQKRNLAGNLIFDGTNKNTDEMIDRLASFAIVSGKETWVYRQGDAATPTITINNLNRRSAPADDRVVNKNRQFGPTQKVVRIIESLDATKTTPIGSSTWGSPNNLNEAVIYTQRIVNYILNTAPTAETRIWTSTCLGSPTCAWTPYVNTYTMAGTATPLLTIDRHYIISKMMQWVFAHEAAGHDTKLTATASTIGFHDAEGTGGMVDNQVQIITTESATPPVPPGIKFKIPSIFLSGHLSSVQVAP